jgi:hypothetical protein
MRKQLAFSGWSLETRGRCCIRLDATFESAIYLIGVIGRRTASVLRSSTPESWNFPISGRLLRGPESGR